MDRKYLLSCIGEAVDIYQTRIYLFCLMLNHFHLVVETPRGNLNGFMHGILTSYSVYFNKVHNRHGHVTQGRYGARLVSGDEYLLKLSRYVHLNPVKIKIPALAGKSQSDKTEYLRAYRWSSYPAYIGKGMRNKFVDYNPMLSLMGGSQKTMPERYMVFVEGGMDTDDWEFQAELKRSPRSIGDAKFREWVDDCYREQLENRGVREDISFRRIGKELDAEVILKLVAQRAGIEREKLRDRKRDATWRSVAGFMLCKYGGRTQREIAAILGVKTGVAVSCQLKNLKGKLAADAGLREQVAAIECSLQKMRGGR